MTAYPFSGAARLARLLIAGFVLLGTSLADAQKPPELRVLAASDLQPVMPALTAAYEHATGIHLNVSFGSSSTLATQIVNGESVDIFLGADFSFPEKVVAANLADTAQPIAYARGALVLWARKDSPLQPLTQDTLHDARFSRLAIADPDRAPYGRAAVAALTWLRLYDQLKPQLVLAEDIAQAAQFVESGNVQLGLISLTIASSSRFQQIGSFVRIPRTAYPEIRHYAVVIRSSSHRADAHAFLDWLRSPAIQQNLSKYGLDPAP